MDFKNILDKARKENIAIQHTHRKEIVEAFREFWKTNPSEQEFTELTEGIVIFPEVIYIISKD